MEVTVNDNRLLGEKKGNIFYITLNRPEKRNAIAFEMLPEISQMVENQIIDPEIRAIIIKGEGKAFSAGVDFNSLGMLAGRWTGDESAGGAPIRSDIHKYQHYLNRLESIEIPIICAIHGAIFGLALELSLACDFRLMSDDCIWGMPELQFGLIADMGGTSRLHRTVGASRAMEILMTGKRYTAGKALEWGLVSYLYPENQMLLEAEKLAADIAKMAPLAVGATKKIVKQGEHVDLMAQMDMEVTLQSILCRSEDFQEGIQSLMEKRDPQWKRK
jgi:enoyl-CoA hydratase/carnithine racemase